MEKPGSELRSPAPEFTCLAIIIYMKSVVTKIRSTCHTPPPGSVRGGFSEGVKLE